MKFAARTISVQRSASAHEARGRRTSVAKRVECVQLAGAFRSPGDERAAFTLVEVLAALLFMAIVIPVAVQGLQLASRAGEVAQRKSEAARVAERVLNENLVITNSIQSSQTGTIIEGTREFRWTLRS